MATKDEILDAISNMTVLELSELLKDFEDKFGVTAAAPAAVAAAPAAGGGGGGAQGEAEQDEVGVDRAADHGNPTQGRRRGRGEHRTTHVPTDQPTTMTKHENT